MSKYSDKYPIYGVVRLAGDPPILVLGMVWFSEYHGKYRTYQNVNLGAVDL